MWPTSGVLGDVATRHSHRLRAAPRDQNAGGQPGEQIDYMTVLAGEYGEYKSGTCR